MKNRAQWTKTQRTDRLKRWKEIREENKTGKVNKEEIQDDRKPLEKRLLR